MAERRRAEEPGPGPGAAAALRLFVGGTVPLAAGARFDLPPAAAAHVKVRRLQPGALLRLFDGDSGFEWPAEVLAIGRSAVRAGIAAGVSPLPAAAAELPLAATLAFAMPANERVDALVEKASELGAAALVPLMSERSVLRLEGDRAERRRAHWQGVAAAACEQCGRARVPVVHGVQPLQTWLRQLGPLSPAVPPPAPPEAAASSHGAALRCLLSTDAAAPPLPALWPRPQPPRPQAPSHQEAAVALTAWPTGVVFLSGPEGGFGAGEVQAARAAGFVAASLGTRTLRADTAPLAALAWLAVALAGAAAGRGSPGS